MSTAETENPLETANNLLSWSRCLVEPALRTAVGTLPADLEHIAGYHFGWWDEHGRPEETRGGKALRPALVLLTAEAVGGTAASALPAAVAVELVHNFSLLHDDVMDQDATRRHRAAAWRVFGDRAAILAGDALLALAAEQLAAHGMPVGLRGAHVLNTAVQQLIQGQIMDLAFEQRTDVGVSECQRMAQAKTGALLGCACVLGAAFGGGEPEQQEHARRFGEHLGLAFQHTDDLLGIWADPDVTGKPSYSDLHARKKTLPVVAALTSGTPAGRELAALYHRETPLSSGEVIQAAELIEAAGGRCWSQSQASDQLDHALHHLRAARPTARAAELNALAQLVTTRER